MGAEGDDGNDAMASLLVAQPKAEARRKPPDVGVPLLGAPARTAPALPEPPGLEPAMPPRIAPEPELLSFLFGSSADSRPTQRLAGTPNMFGDYFNNVGGQVAVTNALGGTAVADLPLAAGCRRVKVAENDKALTMDRVYFLYNHFQNALGVDAHDYNAGAVARKFSVDRYTLGFEKTLFDGLWSVELRMPLAGQTEYLAPGFGVAGGNAGNLAVIVKRMIYESDTAGAVVGLGIDTPTGSDVDGHAGAIQFTMSNQAVHLLPYVGFVSAPSKRLFYQGFLQADVPTNGNPIDYSGAASGTFGSLSEQTLLYVDVSAGYWLSCRVLV